MVNNRRLHHMTCTDHDLTLVNFLALEFTNQKNGVRGELVGLGRSGHPTWCPVLALINRVKHLRSYRAPPALPLYSYYQFRWQSITTTTLTTYLRYTVTAMGAQFGITPSDISIRSLSFIGEMAQRRNATLPPCSILSSSRPISSADAAPWCFYTHAQPTYGVKGV